MSNRLHLRLVTDVVYELGGEDPQTLKANLERLPHIASGEGLFTGDGPATVEEWSSSVHIIPNPGVCMLIRNMEDLEKWFDESDLGTRETYLKSVLTATELEGWFDNVEDQEAALRVMQNKEVELS